MYIALLPKDELAVGDFDAKVIKIFDSDGNYLRQFPSLGGMWGVLYYKERLFVMDCENSEARIFNLEGNYLKSFGRLGHNPGDLNLPRGIAVTHDGNLVIVDQGNHLVQIFDTEGTFIKKINIQFSSPIDVAVDKSGNMIILEYTDHGGQGGNRVVIVSPEGTLIRTFGKKSDDGFCDPQGLCIDALGTIYIADSSHHTIQVFSQEGVFLGKFGGRGVANGQLKEPRGLRFDMKGHLLVADTENKRVQVFI